MQSFMKMSGVSSAKELPEKLKKKNCNIKAGIRQKVHKGLGKLLTKNSFVLNSDTNIYIEMLSHRRMESTEPVKTK